MATFQRLNRERGLTVILVTHDAEIAYHARRMIRPRDGHIETDEPVDDTKFRNAELELRNCELEGECVLEEVR